MNANRIYCIDTSAFLDAWRRDYPKDIFEGFWQNIEQIIDDGRLIAPEEVFLELKRGGDELYEWATKRRHMFLQPEKEVQQIVEEIVNRFPEFVPEESTDGIWADPYVIALAAVRVCVVITGEMPANINARVPHIPDICRELGVDFLDIL